MRIITRTMAMACVAAAAALAWATSGPIQSASPTAVAEEAPGYAVEDFNYPQADKIQQEQGIVLKRGDGHIVLAECGSQAGLLEAWSRSRSKVCFRVTGTSGWLTVEIPSVYGITGNAYDTDLTMTVGDEEKHFDVPPNTFTSVGESVDPESRAWMLVEIRTSS